MGSFQDYSSAVDLDDNAFYEELTRQILMLTDEDDDDNKGEYLSRATKFRRMPVVYGGVGSGLVGKDYYSWSEPGRYVVPSWLESLWANGGGGGGGGGTGVFIPSGGVTSRRGKRSGRRRYNNNKATKNNDKGRVYSTVVQKIHVRLFKSIHNGTLTDGGGIRHGDIHLQAYLVVTLRSSQFVFYSSSKDGTYNYHETILQSF